MSQFYATLNRLKHIKRWGLKRNAFEENVKEHSFDVSVVAHLLCVIKNEMFGSDLDVGYVVMAALYHDAHECLTGDLPTPIKNFSEDIHHTYKKLEGFAARSLVNTLPEKMRSHFKPFVTESVPDDVKIIVKAADTICAYAKCIEELDSGNLEFKEAKTDIENRLKAFDSPEVKYFMEHMLPAMHLSVDELLKDIASSKS